MTKGQEDHRRVAMAPTIVAGSLNQSIHLVRKEVLSPLAVRLLARRG